MGTTIKERTIEFIKYKKISVKEFEIRCGLSNGYVANMCKGYSAEKLKDVLSAYPELNMIEPHKPLIDSGLAVRFLFVSNKTAPK